MVAGAYCQESAFRACASSRINVLLFGRRYGSRFPVQNMEEFFLILVDEYGKSNFDCLIIIDDHEHEIFQLNKNTIFLPLPLNLQVS